METTTKKSIHPLTAIAAVSVTLFSLAGIGAITGLIPTGHGQPAPIQAAKPAEDPAKPAAAAAETTTVTTTTVTGTKPAEKHAAHKAARPVEKAARPAAEPVKSVKDGAPITIAQNDPAPTMAPPPPPPGAAPPKPIC